MKDQAIVTTTFNEASLIIADYLQPGPPLDPVATIKRLIEVLDSRELAGALERIEKRVWLRVVK